MGVDAKNSETFGGEVSEVSYTENELWELQHVAFVREFEYLKSKNEFSQRVYRTHVLPRPTAEKNTLQGISDPKRQDIDSTRPNQGVSSPRSRQPPRQQGKTDKANSSQRSSIQGAKGPTERVSESIARQQQLSRRKPNAKREGSNPNRRRDGKEPQSLQNQPPRRKSADASYADTRATGARVTDTRAIDTRVAAAPDHARNPGDRRESHREGNHRDESHRDESHRDSQSQEGPRSHKTNSSVESSGDREKDVTPAIYQTEPARSHRPIADTRYNATDAANKHYSGSHQAMIRPEGTRTGGMRTEGVRTEGVRGESTRGPARMLPDSFTLKLDEGSMKSWERLQSRGEDMGSSNLTVAGTAPNVMFEEDLVGGLNWSEFPTLESPASSALEVAPRPLTRNDEDILLAGKSLADWPHVERSRGGGWMTRQELALVVRTQRAMMGRSLTRINTLDLPADFGPAPPNADPYYMNLHSQDAAESARGSSSLHGGDASDTRTSAPDRVSHQGRTSSGGRSDLEQGRTSLQGPASIQGAGSAHVVQSRESARSSIDLQGPPPGHDPTRPPLSHLEMRHGEISQPNIGSEDVGLDLNSLVHGADVVRLDIMNSPGFEVEMERILTDPEPTTCICGLLRALGMCENHYLHEPSNTHRQEVLNNVLVQVLELLLQARAPDPAILSLIVASPPLESGTLPTSKAIRKATLRWREAALSDAGLRVISGCWLTTLEDTYGVVDQKSANISWLSFLSLTLIRSFPWIVASSAAVQESNFFMNMHAKEAGSLGLQAREILQSHNLTAANPSSIHLQRHWLLWMATQPALVDPAYTEAALTSFVLGVLETAYTETFHGENSVDEKRLTLLASHPLGEMGWKGSLRRPSVLAVMLVLLNLVGNLRVTVEDEKSTEEEAATAVRTKRIQELLLSRTGQADPIPDRIKAMPFKSVKNVFVHWCVDSCVCLLKRGRDEWAMNMLKMLARIGVTDGVVASQLELAIRDQDLDPKTFILLLQA